MEAGNFNAVSPQTMREVLEEVTAQRAQWGKQQHCPFEWLAILSEELGKTARAMVKERFEGGEAIVLTHELKPAGTKSWRAVTRTHLVNVAAVALSWLDQTEQTAEHKIAIRPLTPLVLDMRSGG